MRTALGVMRASGVGLCVWWLLDLGLGLKYILEVCMRSPTLANAYCAPGQTNFLVVTAEVLSDAFTAVILEVLCRSATSWNTGRLQTSEHVKFRTTNARYGCRNNVSPMHIMKGRKIVSVAHVHRAYGM